jgi:hypothetical protein
MASARSAEARYDIDDRLGNRIQARTGVLNVGSDLSAGRSFSREAVNRRDRSDIDAVDSTTAEKHQSWWEPLKKSQASA